MAKSSPQWERRAGVASKRTAPAPRGEVLNLVRQEFGSEGAAYVRRYLESSARWGKRLGPLLLRGDIEAGTTWALVPAEASLEERFGFMDGLFPAAGPGEMVEGVGLMVPKFRPQDHPQIQQAVAELLARPSRSPGLVCAEWCLGDRTKSSWDDYDDIFFCGDAVYGYAMADAPPEEAAGNAGGRPELPDVAIVTELPPSLPTLGSHQFVDPVSIEEMAEAAIAIMVGAWDDDSFLVWEPAGGLGN